MRLRTIAAGAAALALTGLTIAPAWAAAPGNDAFAGAVTVPAVPFATTADTTGATTDADDTAANTACGAPAVERSVWYTLTAPQDTAYLVNVQGSSFDAGIIVVTGTPSSFTLVGCGPDAIAFSATAGTTYRLLLFDPAPGGAGGQLDLEITVTDPPPTVDIAVHPSGTFDEASGTATVTGTVSCVGLVESTLVQGELRQPVGQAIVVGYFQAEVTCDGVSRPWTAEVPPYYPGTAFGVGGTVSMTLATACGPYFCSTDYDERDVTLTAS